MLRTGLIVCACTLALGVLPQRAQAGWPSSVALSALSTSQSAASPRSRKQLERGKRPSKKRSTRSSGGGITVPIDVGIGPVGILGANSVFADQLFHLGMALSVAAVIDRELILQNRDRIPRQYRKQAESVESIRYRPLWLALIPETIIVSPAFWNTGMYGAIWRPLGLGFPLKIGPTTLSFGAAIDLCYLFVHSATLPSPTHFVRPGLNVHATLLLPLSEVFLVSTGWSSDFFIPQQLGTLPWALPGMDDLLWHLGGPFLKLHFRFPYTAEL